MKILIVNGPNINLLGKREPSIYGAQSFDDYFAELKTFYPQVELEYFQSNVEGEMINKIHEKGFEYDGKHYTMYEGTQLQRRIENEIRKAKRFQISAINGDNEKGIIKAQSKITKLNKVYKEISEASGLKPKTNRMKVPGYKRIRIN